MLLQHGLDDGLAFEASQSAAWLDTTFTSGCLASNVLDTLQV